MKKILVIVALIVSLGNAYSAGCNSIEGQKLRAKFTELLIVSGILGEDLSQNLIQIISEEFVDNKYTAYNTYPCSNKMMKSEARMDCGVKQVITKYEKEFDLKGKKLNLRNVSDEIVKVTNSFGKICTK